MSKRKISYEPAYDRPNQDIYDFLMELAFYELYNNKIYKFNNYRNAAEMLSALPGRIKNAYEAMKLPGIGKKIADHINEFLETGTHKELQQVKKDDKQDAIILLMKIPGIGPAKAEQLISAGIETLEDLKQHEDKLNRQQRIELKYFDDFEKKITRDEIMRIENLFKDAIEELDNKYLVTFCGSYRRGLEDNEPIIAVVTHPDYKSNIKKKDTEITMKAILECLEDKNLIRETISLGAITFMGACRLPRRKKGPFRRLNIQLVFYDHYYCAALYYTGSEIFNKVIRAHALEKKYILNKHTLKSVTTGKIEEITSEKSIFDILGLSYEFPQWRNA
ncbi:DNA polymerase beta [Harpegnathos saltator]|uniref:DNA polymerase n=1 Tax=Harpegnathos saltator TaxID=610380 RepID=E2BD47_HARSA|nr:DNA polymerase beta [Harpegnathos saltator]XP_019696155.1 DNA polymerase beta [Harpegnathos saltator]XP_025163172.1 DNA polymerase beta [Harpegnathos saltator]XP_025163179.1 DNA polymerase beta [Harpegnathos saltator]EFN86389.1 DNA polymerase beta [Harpegnathos saltator]